MGYRSELPKNSNEVELDMSGVVACRKVTEVVMEQPEMRLCRYRGLLQTNVELIIRARMKRHDLTQLKLEIVGCAW